MKRVQPRFEEYINDLTLEQSEFIYVNYSYCFAKDKLYLFWPQKWDVEEELRHRLLGLDYCPPHDNSMLRLTYNSQERIYIVEKLKWTDNNGIRPVPRRGCIGLDIGNDSRFYILGGVHDSRLDFHVVSTGINLAIVQEDAFTICPAAKRKERQERLNSRNTFLKPKMNYRV